MAGPTTATATIKELPILACFLQTSVISRLAVAKLSSCVASEARRNHLVVVGSTSTLCGLSCVAVSEGGTTVFVCVAYTLVQPVFELFLSSVFTGPITDAVLTTVLCGVGSARSRNAE